MNYYQAPQQPCAQPGYQQPAYPQAPPVQPTQPTQPIYPYPPTTPPVTSAEQSYIENILRLNLGKEINVYMNFEDSTWGSKIFKGILEAAGKDHIIISDTTTGVRYILLSIYLDYITFEGEINYYYPYADNR